MNTIKLDNKCTSCCCFKGGNWNGKWKRQYWKAQYIQLLWMGNNQYLKMYSFCYIIFFAFISHSLNKISQTLLADNLKIVLCLVMGILDSFPQESSRFRLKQSIGCWLSVKWPSYTQTQTTFLHLFDLSLFYKLLLNIVLKHTIARQSLPNNVFVYILYDFGLIYVLFVFGRIKVPKLKTHTNKILAPSKHLF